LIRREPISSPAISAAKVESLFHLLDVTWRPGLVEEGFCRTADSQDDREALVRKIVLPTMMITKKNALPAAAK
jgi:hypothetical protein